MVTDRQGQKKNRPKDGALIALGLGLPEDDDNMRFGQATPPEAPPATPVEFNDFTQPFYLRHRLLSMTGALVTIGWLSASAWYIQTYIGWDVLFELLPHEVGGLTAGVLTPLALMWMVIMLVTELVWS